MKFIVVTQAFKAVGLLRPNQLPKPKETTVIDPDIAHGVDSGAALQSDTSADGVEFEFDAGNPHAAMHAQMHCLFNVMAQVSNPGHGVPIILHILVFAQHQHCHTHFKCGKAVNDLIH